MPRVRRKRVDVYEHSERTRIRLLTGSDLIWWDGDELTEDELRAAWEELRDELIEEHIREFPGTRPWAWWAYDRGIEQPLQLQDKPGETAYLNAHGLLTDQEQRAFGRRQSRPAQRTDGGHDD